MELTVKDLIEVLQKYDGDLPVIFGAKFKTADVEFDDWLDFDSVKISQQYVCVDVTKRKAKTRDVVNIELKY